MSDFKSDVKTLNNSAFYPGCGNDFDLIWNPPTGAEIENWVLCDWPAWKQDGVLVDVFEVNLEKVFCEKAEENGFQIIGEPKNYTKEFEKKFKNLKLLNNPPSYLSAYNENSEGQPNQIRVLFYLVKDKNSGFKHIWLLLGFEGLTTYQALYCMSPFRKCKLYIRKQGVGTKGSQNYEQEASEYLLGNFIMNAPKTLAEYCDGFAQQPTFASISELRFAPLFISENIDGWAFYRFKRSSKWLDSLRR